jgi:hypothetical protein
MSFSVEGDKPTFNPVGKWFPLDLEQSLSSSDFERAAQ